MRERQRQPLRNVYIARTVPDQRPLESLTCALARRIGRAANLKSVNVMHMTFLESAGLKQTLVQYGYQSSEVVALAGGLKQFLDKRGHRRAMHTPIDEDMPLRWMTTRGNVKVLAVNLLPTEQLVDARGHIEEFLRGQLGVVPARKSFVPHVTLGVVHRSAIRGDMHTDPSILVPAYARVPQEVALNGLEVYLDRIDYSTTQVELNYGTLGMSSVFADPKER